MTEVPVTLNVGGKTFVTTEKTLEKSSVLHKLVSSKSRYYPIFIDRSPKAFTHVLDYLRDNNHKVPEEYRYELDYYKVEYTDDNIRITSCGCSTLAAFTNLCGECNKCDAHTTTCLFSGCANDLDCSGCGRCAQHCGCIYC
jgi:hypothetical protein